MDESSEDEDEVLLLRRIQVADHIELILTAALGLCLFYHLFFDLSLGWAIFRLFNLRDRSFHLFNRLGRRKRFHCRDIANLLPDGL